MGYENKNQIKIIYFSELRLETARAREVPWQSLGLLLYAIEISKC
jgi:hypothetical protein